MPDWLVQVLSQLPIAVVIGFVGWYCYRKIERAADVFLAREDRIRDAATAQVAEAHRAEVAAKDEVIRRLEATIEGDLRWLTKAVNDLAKRPGG